MIPVSGHSILPNPQGSQFSLPLEGEGWGIGNIAGMSPFEYSDRTPPTLSRSERGLLEYLVELLY